MECKFFQTLTTPFMDVEEGLAASAVNSWKFLLYLDSWHRFLPSDPDVVIVKVPLACQIQQSSLRQN